MTREVIKNARTGEEYIKIIHDTGLEILIKQMPGFSFKHAIFGTRYGSVNTTFKTNADADFVTVPEGIAHYLEHKLFENEDCDVFDLYAQTGAFGNAYTSFDKTCYLFSCTDNFIPSLRILLDFVQKPYFTEETVAKEQGIIGQEIKMYDDNPEWRVFFGLLEGIYHKNPVRINIAGTVESIAEITPELLYRCYYSFYNLHNMTLAIAGDVDEAEILKACDELLIKGEDKGLVSIVPEEPEKVAREYGEQEFEIAVPMFAYGFKSAPVSDKELPREHTLGQITMSLLADETSSLYKRLYDDGLINSEFSADIFSGNGFFVPNFGGESKDPKRVAELINEEIELRKVQGFEPERFENAKKAYYGSLVRSLGDAQNVATLLIDTGLSHAASAFEWLEASAAMTMEDIKEFMKRRFDISNTSMYVIKPKEGGSNGA